jgi:hypothetical protein
MARSRSDSVIHSWPIGSGSSCRESGRLRPAGSASWPDGRVAHRSPDFLVRADGRGELTVAEKDTASDWSASAFVIRRDGERVFVPLPARVNRRPANGADGGAGPGQPVNPTSAPVPARAPSKRTGSGPTARRSPPNSRGAQKKRKDKDVDTAVKDINLDEVAFDDPDLLPEPVIKAWQKHYRTSGSPPTLLFARLPDGQLTVVDCPCRVEALRRCEFTDIRVHVIGSEPARSRKRRTRRADSGTKRHVVR